MRRALLPGLVLVAAGVAFGGVAMEPSNGRWWATLGDSELTALIERALAANLDVKVASSRLIEARADRRGARANLLPSIESSNNLRHVRGGLTSGLFDRNQTSSLLTPTEKTFDQLGFDASWEIDLFGGRRHALQAAAADVAAIEEARRDTLVSVEAEVARNYVELRGCQRRLDIVRQNIKLQEDVLELTTVRADAGLGTELEVERQAAQLDATRAAVPSLESEQLRIIHRLDVLLGLRPGELLGELTAPHPFPIPLAASPACLPADLLKRRPDVRQAEALVAAESARVGVARSDLFPKIMLTGAAGRQATDASGLALGAGNFFPIGPSITLPIFSGGRIRARIEAQQQRLDQARTRYQSAVLRALEEGEDSLAAHQNEMTRRTNLAAAVEASRQSTALARELYAGGLSDFLGSLDAERRQLAAEDELAQSDTAVLTDLIALYKALGGGWQVARQPR